VMATLLEDRLYPGMYSSNLKGTHVEMRSLSELIAKKLPKLHAHMDHLGCDISILVTDW
jgi:Rab-GTPase-TBC domain